MPKHVAAVFYKHQTPNTETMPSRTVTTATETDSQQTLPTPPPPTVAEPSNAIAPETDLIEVEFNEQAGTAKITLENGTSVTFKEPKAKAFVYFADAVQSSPESGGIIATYRLAHLMVAEWWPQQAIEPVEIPSFDAFMDALGDSDLARVASAFACFPNILARLESLTAKSAL